MKKVPQFDLLINIRDKVSETHDSIERLRSIKQQVREWVQRAEGHSSLKVVSDSAVDLEVKLSLIEDELIQVDYKGARERLHLPVKLNAKLAELSAVVSSADFPPPKQTYDVFYDFSERIDEQIRRLQDIVQKDVSSFENLVNEVGIPAIVPKPMV